MIQRIAVMGAGSLGTTMGAFLTRSGYDVTLVDAYREHVDALNQSGAHITGSVDITIPVRACCADCMEGNFDLFLYMAKQTHNAVAIPQMLAHSHNRTIVATCQNGLPEEALAEYFPRERILGVPTGWGGIFQGPGCTLLPSSLDSMACSVGTLTGTHLPELDEVAEILGSFLHVSISSNLSGLRWSKLIFNSAYSGLSTITGLTLGQIIADPVLIRLICFIARESLRVAKGRGIHVENYHCGERAYNFEVMFAFSGEPDVAQAMEDAKGYVGPAGGGVIASMLQDIKRNIPCEVDAINGAVCRQGTLAEVPTPVNGQLVQLIRRIQAGELPYQRENAELLRVD